MSTNDEIAAPMGTEAWDDTALLEAFERAAASHNQSKIRKEDKLPKASASKKKTTVIFKRPIEQDDQESEDDGEAYIAPQSTKTDPSITHNYSAHAPIQQQYSKNEKSTAAQQSNPTTQPYPTNAQSQFEPYQSQAYTTQNYPIGYQQQLVPTLPDMEEQEALSQLLLAWYQAGYAAGRYASIRQRHYSVF